MSIETVIASIESADTPAFRQRLRGCAYSEGADAILDLDNVLDAMGQLGAPDMARVERVARVALSTGESWRSIVRDMARLYLRGG